MKFLITPWRCPSGVWLVAEDRDDKEVGVKTISFWSFLSRTLEIFFSLTFSSPLISGCLWRSLTREKMKSSAFLAATVAAVNVRLAAAHCYIWVCYYRSLVCLIMVLPFYWYIKFARILGRLRQWRWPGYFSWNPHSGLQWSSTTGLRQLTRQGPKLGWHEMQCSGWQAGSLYYSSCEWSLKL